MKRTYLTLIIMMLVIGFAAVTTNLVINGTINFGYNNNDFNSNIVFTYTNTMHGEATIINEGKSITFKTTKLENVGQQAILDFDIANKSSQYDASVNINCGLDNEFATYSEYIDITQDLGNDAFDINSGETKSGRLTITLKKAYNESLEVDINMLCTITATPEERDTEGTYTPVEHEYEEILLNGADPVLEATPVEGIALAAETNEKKLIPVIIEDDGTVKRADTTKEWYDYETKQWANAVILNDGVEEPEVGSNIDEDNIESYFVWIPKYRYKLWNVEGTIKTEPFAIEIEFGTEDTIDNETECIAPNKSAQTGQCANGKWMTHPAFTSLNVNGFWVGKFETGYREATSSTFIEANKTITDIKDISKILIKPNQYCWRFISLDNAYLNSFNYKRNLESHLIKNTEWGAVAYLSHSMYGTCDDNECTEVSINNSFNCVTGFAAKNEPINGRGLYKDYGNVIPGDEANENGEFKGAYNYKNNLSTIASTTHNYTGIYDMNGANWEWVMSSFNNDEEDNNESSFQDIDSKYIDKYLKISDIMFGERILGDATGEMGPFSYSSDNINVSSWYKDAIYGYNDIKNKYNLRGGGNIYGTYSGIFSFFKINPVAWSDRGFRIVLSPQ